VRDRRCWGITNKNNLSTCNRRGDWIAFCRDHERQPIGWAVAFFLFFSATLTVKQHLFSEADIQESPDGSGQQPRSPFPLYGYEMFQQASESVAAELQDDPILEEAQRMLAAGDSELALATLKQSGEMKLAAMKTADGLVDDFIRSTAITFQNTGHVAILTDIDDAFEQHKKAAILWPENSLIWYDVGFSAKVSARSKERIEAGEHILFNDLINFYQHDPSNTLSHQSHDFHASNTFPPGLKTEENLKRLVAIDDRRDYYLPFGPDLADVNITAIRLSRIFLDEFGDVSSAMQYLDWVILHGFRERRDSALIESVLLAYALRSKAHRALGDQDAADADERRRKIMSQRFATALKAEVDRNPDAPGYRATYDELILDAELDEALANGASGSQLLEMYTGRPSYVEGEKRVRSAIEKADRSDIRYFKALMEIGDFEIPQLTILKVPAIIDSLETAVDQDLVEFAKALRQEDVSLQDDIRRLSSTIDTLQAAWDADSGAIFLQLEILDLRLIRDMLEYLAEAVEHPTFSKKNFDAFFSYDADAFYWGDLVSTDLQESLQTSWEYRLDRYDEILDQRPDWNRLRFRYAKSLLLSAHFRGSASEDRKKGTRIIRDLYESGVRLLGLVETYQEFAATGPIESDEILAKESLVEQEN